MDLLRLTNHQYMIAHMLFPLISNLDTSFNGFVWIQSHQKPSLLPNQYTRFPHRQVTGRPDNQAHSPDGHRGRQGYGWARLGRFMGKSAKFRGASPASDVWLPERRVWNIWTLGIRTLYDMQYMHFIVHVVPITVLYSRHLKKNFLGLEEAKNQKKTCWFY